MKKIYTVLCITALTSSIAYAGIIENTFNTAGNLTHDVLETPHNIVHGPHSQEDSRLHARHRNRYQDTTNSYNRNDMYE